jgi:TonB family protein
MEMQSAPQQFAGLPKTLSGERRLRARRSPSALTYVALAENNGGIVANISETGMAMIVAEPLRENSLSHLSFRLPQLIRAIETGAEIVWMTESKKQAGVRFVGLPEEDREQIRSWVTPVRGNRKCQEHKEHPRNVEDHLSTASTAAAMPVRPASGKSVLESRRLTETRRAEFERMFPSEHGATNSREISASKTASRFEPVAEADSVAASPAAVPAPESVPTHVLDQEFAPKAQPDRSTDDAPVHAPTAPRAPMPTPCASPPVLEPIVDRGLRATFRSETTRFVSRARPRRLWPIAALTTLVVGTCFALGFVAGPDYLRDWPKAQDVGHVNPEKLSRFKTTIKNADPSNQNVPNTLAPSSNVPADNLGAAPETPAPTVATNPSGNVASDESAPGDSATPPLAERPNTGTSEIKTPDESASYRSEPFVPQHKLKPRRSKKSTFSANLSASSEGTSNAAAVPPERARTSPALAEKTPGPRPADSEPLEMVPETQSEEPPSSPAVNPAVNSALNAPAPAKALEITGAPDTSLPAKSNAMPATDSSTRQPALSDDPATEAAVPSVRATPPALVAQPAPHPANPPPSFFPVVPPGAGNVPRLLELPLETVIDTAAILIHSRQFVFVPAEPGPESSHKPLKVQMGERISKVAPAYPVQAAQKGMGGTVHLRATIGKGGTVESVRPINGPTLLIPVAVDAVRQWRYQPTLLNQHPIEMQEDVTIEFRPLG